MIRVVVKCDPGIPDDVQAKAMFDFELALRERSGLDVCVYKERMADDSALRRVMDMRREKK
jgi:hypothetical protein